MESFPPGEDAAVIYLGYMYEVPGVSKTPGTFPLSAFAKQSLFLPQESKNYDKENVKIWPRLRGTHSLRLRPRPAEDNQGDDACPSLPYKTVCVLQADGDRLLIATA